MRPLQFALKGYSVVGHYALNDRTQIGASVFAATLSDGIIDFVWDTEGSLELEAKQDIVIGLSYRYFLNKRKPHQSWFVGTAAGVEFYTLTNQNDGQELDYTFYFLAPRIGYIWYPLKSKVPNFFVTGEVVAVFPLINDGKVTFESGATADINDFLPSPLIGIGYRF
ncbi:hypothetical protein MTsPCn9_06800 [Croceitalea sp. MTPC9]|uniref:hypothetical protein n=1 Tax=unclassified Croceitalea TaxID=2632280 RepID=UPI002B3CEEC7|nr:hypothetical protein MTsPCn6_01910 [Croceitalea sp. MTPC6]GMN15744.1 hypothetical protein MTsPCn9_06800 [Croceitalea sp. MTPC9]